MRLLALGLFLGILLIQLLASLPPKEWGYGLIVVVPAILFLWRLRVFLAVLIGVLYVSLIAHQHILQQLPKSVSGKDLIVEGVVTSIPDNRGTGRRFRFQIDKVHTNNNPTQSLSLNGEVRLSWYRTLQTPKAGEKWRLVVRLKQGYGFRNPGGFDYEKWLFSERLIATGYVRKSAENKRLEVARPYAVNTFRSYILEKIHALVPDTSQAAIISALAVASRAGITDEQWTIFRSTGTNHLIAISGLHIGLVAGFGFLLVWPIWWLFPRLYLWMPVQIAGGVAGAGLAIGYALLAGLTLPTQRALIMVLAVLFALLVKRRYASSTVFSLALFLVLLFDPLAVLSSGFWLSFIAVGLIFYALKRPSLPKGLNLISIQLLLSLAMLPLTLALFGTGSLSSPIANLFAIPWVSIFVVPLILLGIVSLMIYEPFAEILFNMAGTSIDILFQVLSALSHPLLSISLPEVPMFITLLAFVGVIVLWLPYKTPWRWLGLTLILPLLWVKPESVKEGAFRFYSLDVGQGTASVVQTKNHILLYDAGPKAGKHFDTGKLVVVPFLRAKGMQKLDMLAISHEDMDHRGGAQAVMKVVPVEQVMSSNILLIPNTQRCEAGQHWQWDGVSFEVLFPAAEDYERELSDNNLSCVIRVSNAHHHLLLAGDIEKEAEQDLLSRYGKQLKSEVMTVPHHGSKTSSTESFLDAVSSDLAINSAAYMSRFNHPAPSIQQRYIERDIRFLSNVEEGAIQLDFPASEEPYEIYSYRQENQRYWHHSSKN
ncbi:MAG: DNA internalization-related competence protein ComEC/Rec2 [uncultured Thiotrichaceae bacterium]|uniref:DNA internalization-related competence protein ComEC/Rec2 n=1 Tax=uncultured Thiotrichaceae bacterium TaxID=298394 RepID=A0A6S6SB04_9GAMM|nr:MAG: DNA internalization-related competence protein ComEC/Rec2 [uncultured Thiotrichaceae bacterium]